MAQTYPPAPSGGTRPVPDRRARPARSTWWIDLIIVLALVAVAYGVVAAAARATAPMTPTVEINRSLSSLPLYAGLSTLRMAIAYVLALVFSLVYARLAVSSVTLERVLLPILDILQSVPILSFLPGVVLGLIAIFPGSNLGLELAAIVLIFTSQAWNITFGFYQSLRTIPKELQEAASVFRLNFWQRFTRLELPSGMISLIWNSMMSWAGGWFFLMAAEQFRLGDRDFRLPGLGSYLADAANDGDIGDLLLGLATLVVVIVLLDVVLWRPLVAWGERFKIEQTAASEPARSTVLTALQRSALSRAAGEAAHRARVRLATMGYRGRPAAPNPARVPSSLTMRTSRPLLSAVLLAGLATFGLWGLSQALPLLRGLDAADWAAIAAGAGATLLRTLIALTIAVAWTVPLGVAIGMNPRLSRRLQPLVQMVAAIPATALFPALLLLLLNLPGGLNIAAILLMLLGTQWYVLFNVIAGAMSIPTDLQQVAALFKLSRWQRWRHLILPGIFPYLVTGMITATGGAWNASVVAEYVSFGGRVEQTVGLGALIASSASDGQFGLLLAGTLTMSTIVVTANALVWRRLYRLAERRFRLE